jgi:DNA-binding response OmpR family regulator
MPRVLVCDKESAENGLLLQVLSGQGYEVVFVPGLEAALRELASTKFRLLLLGIQGEAQQVRDFLCQVRALHRDVALITMVDEDSIEVQKMIRKEKVFYHLVRPFEETEILQAVRSALARG